MSVGILIMNFTLFKTQQKENEKVKIINSDKTIRIIWFI